MAETVNKSSSSEINKIHKNEAFYSQRFECTRKKESSFVPFTVRRNGVLIGFVICKTHPTNFGIEGIITDLQIITNETEALDGLIYNCAEYYKQIDALYVRLWAKKPSHIVRLRKRRFCSMLLARDLLRRSSYAERCSRRKDQHWLKAYDYVSWFKVNA